MILYERLKNIQRYGDDGARLKAYKKFTGNVGLEIETESNEIYPIPDMKFWFAQIDPSLRGKFNQEYTLKQPVRFQGELDSALNEFQESTKNIKFIKNSITSSVHVHLNFLNSTFREMGNFITAYALTENLLSNYAGENRKSNLFCLSIRDAEETYKNCVSLFQKAEKQDYANIFFKEQHVKYAALNLSALKNFGSLEIRSFRGETNIIPIKKWISILENLYKYSHEKDRTPKDILLDWKNKQAEVLPDIYGDYAKELIYKDYISDLNSNVWYAACIAYSVKNWIKIDEVKNEEKEVKKYTMKELNQAAKHLFGFPMVELDLAQIDHVHNWLNAREENKQRPEKLVIGDRDL